ncbi:MAG TPA: MFS transporter [Bacilli bacterium]|nr:MFS transporter [Bacilli bacterium]
MSTEVQASPSLPEQKPPEGGGIFHTFRASRNFTALWSGQTMSRFGDVLMQFMLPLIVYDISSSTVAMGTIMMLLLIPQVILLPFTGLLVDRLNRVRLMIVTDVVRLGLMAYLVAMSMVGTLSMTSLYVFAVVAGAMSAIFNPAYGAVRAQVFTPEIRNAANSLTQSSNQLAQLVGPSLAGLLLGVTSYAFGLGVDAATFLASILSLLLLRLPKRVREKQPWSLRAFGEDLLGGYRVLRQHAWLWITILAFCFINIASSGIIAILLPWLVKVHLGWNELSYGLILSASGVGALLSATIWGRRNVWPKRGILAYLATSLCGVALLGMAFAEQLWLLVLLNALQGGVIMIFGLVWEGSLQELVPEEAFGRVYSLDMFGSIALMPIGFMLTGWLAEVYGGLQVMIVEGSMVAIGAALMLLVPAIRRFE